MPKPTPETPRLRRTVVYVHTEVEATSPGTGAAMLQDYSALLRAGESEAEIVVALLSIVVMMADEAQVDSATRAALSKMQQG